MVNITLSVSDTLYKKMKEYSEYRWSEVARKAIEKKIAEAQLIEDLGDIEETLKEHKQGKTISLKQVAKELGLEDEL